MRGAEASGCVFGASPPANVASPLADGGEHDYVTAFSEPDMGFRSWFLLSLVWL